jgi:uncharacterized membrane protein YbaN (DUF454 family)
MQLLAAEVFMILIYFLFRRQKRKLKNQVLVGHQSLGNVMQNLLIQILEGKSCCRLNFSRYILPLTFLYLHSLFNMETCFNFMIYQITLLCRSPRRWVKPVKNPCSLNFEMSKLGFIFLYHAPLMQKLFGPFKCRLGQCSCILYLMLSWPFFPIRMGDMND